MRLALRRIALLAALAVACGPKDRGSGPAKPQPPKTARHLLLITIDTLRAGHLGYMGGRRDVSPVIDALAAEGTVFLDAQAPTGMTLASVTSLMTSKYPDETGVRSNLHQVRQTEHTLAERLREAGFRTRGFVANGVLRAGASGIDQGFDELTRADQEGYLTHLAAELLVNDFGKDPERRDFLWLHYMDPHQPYQRREPWATRFDPDYEEDIDTSEETLQRIFIEKTPLADHDLEHVRAVYDSQIRRVDLYLRSILAALERSGAADETLLVLTADHGEELFDHNLYPYHANSLYRSVTHVPLLFRFPPAVPPNRRVEGLCELVDVLPTILTLLGLDARDEDERTRTRGRDLYPAMLSGRTDKRFTYSQLLDQAYAIRDGEWTLVVNPNGYRPRSVPEEGEFPIPERALFHLPEDPFEQHDVLASHEDEARALAQRLSAWRAGIHSLPSILQQTTEADREELEQLGYLAGNPDDGG